MDGDFHANVQIIALPRQSPALIYRVRNPIYIIRYPGEDIWDVLGAVPAERSDAREYIRSILGDAALQRPSRVPHTGAALSARLAAAQMTRVDFHVSPISSLASAIQIRPRGILSQFTSGFTTSAPPWTEQIVQLFYFYYHPLHLLLPYW